MIPSLLLYIIFRVQVSTRRSKNVTNPPNNPVLHHSHIRKLPITDVEDDEFEDDNLGSPPWTNQFPNRFSSIVEAGGTLTLIPPVDATFGFYGNGNGGFISQSISAGTNFVMEASLTVSDVNGDLPDGDWQSSGLLARSSTASNDFVMINLGRQGPAFGMPRTYGTQAMSTDNGSSTFAYAEGPLTGMLRICRVGDEITLLRNLGGEGWTAVSTQNNGTPGGPISRPDLAGALDIGMMLSRYRNSDVNMQSVFDYVHFSEPDLLEHCFAENLDDIGQTDAPTSSPTIPPTLPPLEIFSDEFSYFSSFNDWTDHYPSQHNNAEGAYIFDGVLTIDIHDPELFDSTNCWFDSDHGNFLSKSLSGDFVVETHVSIRRVNGGIASGSWNVGGLAVRSANDDSNWVVVNLGLQGNAAQFGYHESLTETVGVEGKTTVNDISTFNYVDRDFSTGPFNQAFQAGRLRICRVGSQFLLLYIVADEPTEWTVVSPYPTESNPGAFTRDDITDEVDVGIMTNSFGGGANDAFTVRFDYVRYSSVSTLADCYGFMTVV